MALSPGPKDINILKSLEGAEISPQKSQRYVQRNPEGKENLNKALGEIYIQKLHV